MNRQTNRNLPLLALAVVFALGTSGCLFGGKAKAPLAGAKAAPDTILYNRSTDDFKHGRYTEGRLDLETLINTYPDSEYLAKAKLAIANSYYEQGGTEGLTQAVAQYKDFITFFPFLDEAAFAQYRVAMAHFRMMEKADRDPTQALDAEAELQTMILKYPKSRWTPDALQRLREVQEVLAEGKFEVATFYDVNGAYGAAAARLLDLTSRYPLFSEADQANMMLAQIYQKTEHNDFAARFYSKVVRDYPLSNLAPEAKRRLIALGYPVPQPDPKALARMQEEGKYIHQRAGMVRQALGMLRSGPDISRSAHFGEPNLTPDLDIVSARQVLVPSVVSMAAAGSGIGSNTVSASAVSSGFSAPVNPAANSVVANSSDASDSGTTSTAAPSSSDPAKGPPANGKNAKPSAKAKKKKGLFHKIVPF